METGDEVSFCVLFSSQTHPNGLPNPTAHLSPIPKTPEPIWMDYGAAAEAEEAAAVPQAEHKAFEHQGSDSEAPDSPSGLFIKAMRACFGAAAKDTSPVRSACAKPSRRRKALQTPAPPPTFRP